MGQEYAIRRSEFDKKGYRMDFDIPLEEYWNIMSPNSMAYKVQNDNMSILVLKVDGVISFSWEMGFIHVNFEEGKFTDDTAESIMNEIFGNIVTSTNQSGEYFQTI